MPEVTVDDVLVAWRDVLADEAQVVRDYRHLYEDADGGVVPLREAKCGCFRGAADIGARGLGAYYGGPWLDAVRAVEAELPEANTEDWDRWEERFTPFFRDNGREACVAVLDRVIASRRAGEGK